MQVNITLFLEKRQGAFIRARAFSRINKVSFHSGSNIPQSALQPKELKILIIHNEKK